MESDIEDPSDKDLPSTKPMKLSTQKTTCSNSGSNSGKLSLKCTATTTDTDIEDTAPKRQRLTHSTTKSAGKQHTNACNAVDSKLENDDRKEEPIAPSKRALQTQTQNCAPSEKNPKPQEPVAK